MARERFDDPSRFNVKQSHHCVVSSCHKMFLGRVFFIKRERKERKEKKGEERRRKEREERERRKKGKRRERRKERRKERNLSRMHGDRIIIASFSLFTSEGGQTVAFHLLEIPHLKERRREK